MNNKAILLNSAFVGYGGCYPPRPPTSVDNILLELQNSSYPTQPHSIIAKNIRNIEPASCSKNPANGFNVQKSNLVLIFEMTSEFSSQIINSSLHS